MLSPIAFFARLPKGSRAFLSLGLVALAVVPAIAQLPAPPVIDPVKELAEIKAASTLDDDPEDWEAVRAVCTACHSASQYLTTPRSSSRFLANLSVRPDSRRSATSSTSRPSISPRRSLRMRTSRLDSVELP